MIPFYGREQQLKILNDWWLGKKSHLVVVYGKRRIGKTALCLKFAEDKPKIYYLADRLDIKLQLKKLSKQVGKFYKDDYVTNYGLVDWEQLFSYIGEKKKKFVLIIDEFPYMVEADSAISSVFQKGWDLYLEKSNTFLILCGSSIGMMEQHTISYKAPLYGRRTGQILLEPFAFSDLSQIFNDRTFEEKLHIYSIAGGVITYLKFFVGNKNFWNVIEKKMLNKEQFLYQEVEFLLKEELREPRNYFSILQSMSSGKRKISEIINDTGFDKGTISAYLANLNQLLIIEKEVPVTETDAYKSRKGLYRIRDNFISFWFRFIFKYRNYIEEGNQKDLLTIVKKSIGDLLSFNFEEIAKQATTNIMREKSNIRLTNIGRWWDKNTEIDIVGFNAETQDIVFGEVKWTNKPVGINIYEDLVEKSEKVDWNRESRREYYIFFSKNGFTNELIEFSQDKNIILTTKDDL